MKTNHATYASLLRRCGNEKALLLGRRIHARIKASGQHRSTFIANMLMHMYGRCGSVEDAWEVFNGMRSPNVFSWTIMIESYAQNGNEKDALRLFTDMQKKGVKPNKFTFLGILGACASLQALEVGKQVHQCIVANCFESDVSVSNALVTMYGKCGNLQDALAVFDDMHERDVISWTSMITAYTQNRKANEALKLFRQMDAEGVKPNGITYLSILHACSNMGSLEIGKEIHERMVASGLECTLPLRNALLNMYGNCGSLKDARMIFDGKQERDVVSWTTMIAAYVLNGKGREALQLFKQMYLEGMMPNRITFFSILDACASLASLEDGRAIHERIFASGFEFDVAVCNALVSMYGKCGSLKNAQAVFAKMHHRDVISWSAIIAALAQNGRGNEALKLFQQMGLEGIKPNSITFLSILDACASLASLENGRKIHNQIATSGFESHIALNNALVNMYGKCSSLKDARLVFDKMVKRDAISWTAMIAAYTQNGQSQEALRLFQRMKLEGIKPTSITLLCILDVCASLALLKIGRAIHEDVVASGFASDVSLMTALINMYGKCGSLKSARSIFDEMHERDTISWTAIIAAYAHNGQGKEALELFWQMGMGGVKPDRITFHSILNACSHECFLDEGWRYFISMSSDYDVALLLEHYVCMIDLLGRAGYLDEAEDLLNSMPVESSAVAWNVLLGSCRIYGDVERGKRVAEYVSQLDPKHASPYSLLSNIYVAAGRWDDAANVRSALERRC